MAAAEAWEREIKQAIEKVNGRHWGISKTFIREQEDRWKAEGVRCKGMTVAEYFVAVGLGTYTTRRGAGVRVPSLAWRRRPKNLPRT